MAFQERYHNGRTKLQLDPTICAENKRIFEEFFDWEEVKLKRRNGFTRLDEACYKTLWAYTTRFRVVNRWFQNKPWEKLTKEDIQKVYDDLEDGKIRGRSGLPLRDRSTYYNKVMKAKPFALAGKAELAQSIIEFSTRQQREVRFIIESEFRKLIRPLNTPQQQLLFWLAWDIGENINSLLQLKKLDFTKQRHHGSSEDEYLVRLAPAILKRSRTARSECTLYPETVALLDIVLDGLDDNDRLFHFGYAQAAKLMRIAVRKTNARVAPDNLKPTWKDLRSGMACHLLKKGWRLEEVNSRLGHKPSSSEIDRYISHLAINRHRPKQMMINSTVQDLQRELEDTRQREKLITDRLQRQDEQNEQLRNSLETLRKQFGDLVADLQQLDGSKLS